MSSLSATKLEKILLGKGYTGIEVKKDGSWIAVAFDPLQKTPVVFREMGKTFEQASNFLRSVDKVPNHHESGKRPAITG